MAAFSRMAGLFLLTFDWLGKIIYQSYDRKVSLAMTSLFFENKTHNVNKQSSNSKMSNFYFDNFTENN